MPIDAAGMGGNASAQAMAVAVRGLAIGRVDNKLLRHVIIRELYVGLLTGVIIGLITGSIAMAFPGDDIGMGRSAMLGLVIALGALIFNHHMACTTMPSIPFVMKRLGFDPAQVRRFSPPRSRTYAALLLGLASWILL